MASVVDELAADGVVPGFPTTLELVVFAVETAVDDVGVVALARASGVVCICLRSGDGVRAGHGRQAPCCVWLCYHPAEVPDLILFNDINLETCQLCVLIEETVANIRAGYNLGDGIMVKLAGIAMGRQKVKLFLDTNALDSPSIEAPGVNTRNPRVVVKDVTAAEVALEADEVLSRNRGDIGRID